MKLILFAAVAVLLVLPARAEEKTAVSSRSSWSDFFKNLKSSLANSAVSGQQKRGKTAAAVAAVRGDDQAKKNIADPNEPALKGSSKEKRAREDLARNAEFDKAVSLIMDNKPEDGLKALEELKAKHPKYNVENLNKAIEGAKAMIAGKDGASAVTDAAAATP